MMGRRQLEEVFFKGLMMAATAVVMGALVAFIALSILQPIYEFGTSINK